MPLPWSSDRPPFGFSPEDSDDPWLPQPPNWADHPVDRLSGDPASILTLYRDALRIRRATLSREVGTLAWVDTTADVLMFDRIGGLRCAVNLATTPMPLPDDMTVLLASGPLTIDEALPQDTAVWLRSYGTHASTCESSTSTPVITTAGWGSTGSVGPVTTWRHVEGPVGETRPRTPVGSEG